MSVAATITETQPTDIALAPAGMPVRNGRLHLARIRHWLPLDGQVAVVTGFGIACWLGSPSDQPPDLGRHVYRSTATIDSRGRLVLDRTTRAWLAVANPGLFQAVAMPLQRPAGVVVVPIEDYARRVEAVTP